MPFLVALLKLRFEHHELNLGLRPGVLQLFIFHQETFQVDVPELRFNGSRFAFAARIVSADGRKGERGCTNEENERLHWSRYALGGKEAQPESRERRRLG